MQPLTLLGNFISTGVAALLLLTSCRENLLCEKGEGTLQTTSRSVTNFSGVDNRLNAQVFVTQGADYALTVTAQPAISSHISTTVKDGVLVLDLNGCVTRFEQPTITITMPKITSLTISSSGSIEGTNDWVTPDLAIKIRGSGNVTAQVKAGTVGTDMDAEGDLNLSGTASRHTIRAVGSGAVRAFGLLSDEVEIKRDGSGDTQVTTLHALRGTLKGSGNLYYKGTPNPLDVKAEGSGRIIREE